jgi:hypothetical protein
MFLGHSRGPLGGQTFRSDEDMLEAVHEWLRMQPKDFFLHEKSGHYLSDEGHVLNATGTMLKYEKAVPNLFATN